MSGLFLCDCISFDWLGSGPACSSLTLERPWWSFWPFPKYVLHVLKLCWIKHYNGCWFLIFFWKNLSIFSFIMFYLFWQQGVILTAQFLPRLHWYFFCLADAAWLLGNYHCLLSKNEHFHGRRVSQIHSWLMQVSFAPLHCTALRCFFQEHKVRPVSMSVLTFLKDILTQYIHYSLYWVTL